MTTHAVHTDFNGGMAFTADINGHKLVMDTTAEDGGKDSGPSPKRLMLASLAGCTGMDVVSILDKMKVAYSDFSINVHAALTAEHPKIYNMVKITYRIKVAGEDKPKMVKAVSLSQERYCGVSAMLKKALPVTWEISYNGVEIFNNKPVAEAALN